MCAIYIFLSLRGTKQSKMFAYRIFCGSHTFGLSCIAKDSLRLYSSNGLVCKEFRLLNKRGSQYPEGTMWQIKKCALSKFSCHCEERSNLRCLHKGYFAVHKLFAYSALQRIAFDFIPQTVWFAKSLDCFTKEVRNDRSKEVRKTQRARIIVTTIKASKWANWTMRAGQFEDAF